MTKYLRIKVLLGVLGIAVLILFRSVSALADDGLVYYAWSNQTAYVRHNLSGIRYSEIIILQGSSTDPDYASPTHYNYGNIPGLTDLGVQGTIIYPHAFARGLVHYAATPNSDVLWSKTVKIQ